MPGLGPFVLESYQQGQRLVFARNPRYWRRDANGGRLPVLDRLTLEIVPDQNADLLALQTGKVDFTQTEVRPEDYAALKRTAESGSVVLTDLGLASLLEGPGGRARRPRLAGDPPYIPPEAMEHVGIRPAYDQYSLAVVAYEAFCGALPVSCEDGVAVLLRKRVEPPHPLAHRRPDLAPSTCGAVMRALDRDPARRFESCEEFAAAL